MSPADGLTFALMTHVSGAIVSVQTFTFVGAVVDW